MPPGRPKKPTNESWFGHNISFRGDQKEAVAELARRRLLSKVCQKAVDEA